MWFYVCLYRSVKVIIMLVANKLCSSLSYAGQQWSSAIINAESPFCVMTDMCSETLMTSQKSSSHTRPPVHVGKCLFLKYKLESKDPDRVMMLQLGLCRLCLTFSLFFFSFIPQNFTYFSFQVSYFSFYLTCFSFPSCFYQHF